MLVACLSAGTLHAGEAEPALQIGARPWSPAELSTFSARLKNHDDASAVSAATELATRSGSGALRLLAEFYERSGAERRLAAVKALTAPEAASSRALNSLLEKIALGDHSLAVRELAVRGLVRLEGAAPTFERIRTFLEQPRPMSPLLRCRAVHSAALAGSSKAGPLLRALLADPNDDTACAAAAELGEIRELANADVLLTMLDTPRPSLKTAVSDALDRLAGKHFGFDLPRWAQWRADLLPASAAGALPPLDYAGYEKSEKAPVDIIVAFDTTGSFLHVWGDVGHAIDAVLRELVRGEPSVRVGLIRYRSVDPLATLRYTLKITPLTQDFDSVRRELATVSFGGGSGALHEGLRSALQDSPWRPRARKVVLIVGDDSPSSPSENPLQLCIKLAHEAGEVDNIQVNTLYAKTSAGEENRQTYRVIAAAGIGRCYEFNKAERHLVELSAEHIDVKQVELPAETARKWLERRP